MDNGRSLTPHSKASARATAIFYGGIGIVALAHIEQARNAADIAQVFVKKAELAAGQGQDHTVLGDLFHKFGYSNPDPVWRRRSRPPGKNGGWPCF